MRPAQGYGDGAYCLPLNNPVKNLSRERVGSGLLTEPDRHEPPSFAGCDLKPPHNQSRAGEVFSVKSPAFGASSSPLNVELNSCIASPDTQTAQGDSFVQEQQVRLYRHHLLSQLQHVDALLRLQHASPALTSEISNPFKPSLTKCYPSTEMSHPSGHHCIVDPGIDKLAALSEVSYHMSPANSPFGCGIPPVEKVPAPSKISQSGLELMYNKEVESGKPLFSCFGGVGEMLCHQEHQPDRTLRRRRYRRSFIKDTSLSPEEYKTAMLPRIRRLAELTKCFVADKEQNLEVRLRQLSKDAERTFLSFDPRERSHRNTLERQLVFAENQLESYRSRMGLAKLDFPELPHLHSESRKSEDKVASDAVKPDTQYQKDEKTQVQDATKGPISVEDESKELRKTTAQRRIMPSRVKLDEAGRHLEVYPVAQSDGRFKCSLCDKTFKFAKHVRRHSTSHSQIRSFECPQCGSPFNRHDSLMRHQARCNISRRESLSLHVRLREFSQKIVRPSLYGPPIVEEIPMRGKPIGISKTSDLRIIDAVNAPNYYASETPITPVELQTSLPDKSFSKIPTNSSATPTPCITPPISATGRLSWIGAPFQSKFSLPPSVFFNGPTGPRMTWSTQ